MSHRIAVVPGDNIGPEVVREALKVLATLDRLRYAQCEFTEFPWGADYYLQTGLAMPENGLETLRSFDAILFGAHGDPSRIPDSVLSHGLLHKIRKGFDLYVNMRPLRLLPGVVSPIRHKTGMDFVIVRENTEGEYSNLGGRVHMGTPLEMATQVSVITRAGSERVMRFAFELARKRGGKKRVTAATKSNALAHSMTLWDEVFAEVASRYTDVEASKLHVDAFSMALIGKPEWFDVIVATSMFGDILSDEGAMVVGGVGLAPGANLDPDRRYPSMFEPIHGSAPDIAGKGIANPIAAILAAAYMLDWLGETSGADLMKRAVDRVLAAGTVRTKDLDGNASTTDMGDAVSAEVESLAKR